MKKLLWSIYVCTLCIGTSALAADDLSTRAGKWSVKKTNDQGETFTQTIELKKDKFVFEIVGADANVRLHAEGDVKLEKAGPFSSIKFHHIRGGQSESNMQDVDDEYVSIYTLDGDTWTMATNFDKERERQKPSLDIYKRVKAAAAPKTEK